MRLTAWAGYVVTAHTADDRVETLLHNLMRGTGLSGAAGMPQFRSLSEHLVLVRPILGRSRAEVLQFLADRNQPFRQDSSNANTRYGRNYIRHELLPRMLERFPSARENLLSFSELTEEVISDLRRLASNWRSEVERAGNELRGQRSGERLNATWPVSRWFIMPLSLATRQAWTVLREALREVWLERGWPQADMSKERWHDLRACFQEASSQVSTSASPTVRTLQVFPVASQFKQMAM